jgi:NitT/TauT family transport system substrate-binding protein
MSNTRVDRRWSRRRFLQVVGAGVAASGLVACGPTGGSRPTGNAPGASTGQAPAGGQSGNLRKATLLLDVTPYGKHAFFYVPLEKGWYREAGLDITIESAKGSADNVAKVGAKAVEFGFADTSAVIAARAGGAAVRVTCMVHYKNLMAVMSFRNRGNITQLKDLEGKTVAALPGEAGRVVLPALGKINHFDPDKLNIINVDQTGKPAMLAAGQAVAVLDFYTAFPAYVAAARQVNDEALALLYADYGLDLYNNGIVVHDDLLRAEPDLVRRFHEAFVRGMVWTVENPDAANDIMLKYAPQLSKETARAQLQIAIDHLMVDEVRRNGCGPMSSDKMAFTLDTISQYQPLPRAVNVDEVYTNDFVPKGQIPKV